MSSGEVATRPDEWDRLSRSRDRLDLESLAILAGRLAHDFNELLVGVLGNAALARGKLSEESPAYTNVRGIETAALRARDLVGLLVGYSGANSVALGPVCVEEVLRDSVTELAAIDEVVVRAAADVADVSGARCQLRHLVSILLANALAATNRDDDGDGETSAGGVRVSLGETDLAESDRVVGAAGRPLPAGCYVELVVADDGHGMDAATRERVFEPFFTTRDGARGLGLAAALRVVAAHRGAIEVESEPGRGTVVRVLLPPRRQASVVPARRRLVLVVDDDEGVRRVARALLGAAGYDVLIAADGLEAVDVFRAHQDEIDLVLLDRIMPRVGGEATYRALRRVRDDVTVLLCSGEPATEATERLLAEGVAGFVAKPFTSETLLAAVSVALG